MDPWKRTPTQRIEDAKSNKQLGTEKFKKNDFKGAGQFYINALRDIIPIVPLPEEYTEEVNFLKQTCLSNLAACQLKLKQYDRVIRNCGKALDYDSENIKTLYRRACAHIECRNIDPARKDVEDILRLEPENTAAKELDKKLDVLSKKKDENDAKMMKAFLGSVT